MSCSLTYCGGSLIQCKTVIKNNLLFLEKWGRKGVQNGAASNQADYYSQEMMRAIHLCLPIFVILLIVEAECLCIEHFAFRGGYHAMAFQLPFLPRVSFASHTLSLRQLVNLSQVMTLWPQHIWSHTQGLHRTLGCCSHSSQPAVHSACPTGTQSSTATSPGGHWEGGALLQGGYTLITTKCTWKDMSCGVRGT